MEFSFRAAAAYGKRSQSEVAMLCIGLGVVTTFAPTPIPIMGTMVNSMARVKSKLSSRLFISPP